MKTLIAVPCMDSVPVEFMTSFVNLRKAGDTRYAVIKNTLVYDARNQFAAKAIDGGYDRVLWIDSDMTFDSDALDKLNVTMDETGAPYVTGLCFKRRIPTGPTIYKSIEYDFPTRAKATPYADYPRDAVFDVAASGCALVLMETKLIQDVFDKYGPPFTPLPQLGEDLSFCWRVKELGRRMICNSAVKAGHCGFYEFTEDTYLSQVDSERKDA